MGKRDWKATVGGYPVGTWRFDVDSEGGVRVYWPRQDTADFTTRFTATGNRLTIDRVPICPVTGRYTWQVSGRKLTLTVVDDDGCLPRATLFGGTWIRRR